MNSFRNKILSKEMKAFMKADFTESKLEEAIKNQKPIADIFNCKINNNQIEIRIKYHNHLILLIMKIYLKHLFNLKMNLYKLDSNPAEGLIIYKFLKILSSMMLPSHCSNRLTKVNWILKFRTEILHKLKFNNNFCS